MKEYLTIRGGVQLTGSVRVSGAKNSALPLLMASLLSSEECQFQNVPDLDDIEVTVKLIRSLGAQVSHEGSEIKVHTPRITTQRAPHGLVKAMRASFWVLGPTLARSGEARVALPGGDAIGTRPVDIHLQALARLGADIRFQNGEVIASAAGGLKGSTVEFSFPSVGATHQILMTAALIPGETIIKGAAREPEVVELAQFLSSMGAVIEGAGSGIIRIVGQKELSGARISVLGDRIEAATFLISAVMTHGSIEVSGIEPESLSGVLEVLQRMGAEVQTGPGHIKVSCDAHQAVSFSTAPFPGVATDTQPLLLAALTNSSGEGTVTETIFENRFGHAAEYKKFGADVQIFGNTVRVTGVNSLKGVSCEAGDIRAAAGLILMGLAAEGETRIHELHHIDRGYEKIVEKIQSVGGNLTRVPAYDGQELVLGC